jgi:hypothetical protein
MYSSTTKRKRDRRRIRTSRKSGERNCNKISKRDKMETRDKSKRGKGNDE